jgi:hypothetical protein
MHVQVDGVAKNNTPFAMYHPSHLHHPQAPLPVIQMPIVQEQAPKSQAKKAVGKREIQRRAEACVQKAVAASTPQQPTSMPIRSPSVSNITTPSLFQRQPADKVEQPSGLTPSASLGAQLHTTSVSFDSIPGTATASVNNDQSHDTDHDNDADQDNDDNEGEGDGEGEGDVEHAAVNDVDDDADDESELSELDESEVQEMEQAVQEHERRSASFATVKPLFPGLYASRASAERASTSMAFGSPAGQSVFARGEGHAGEGDKMDVDGEKEGAKR